MHSACPCFLCAGQKAPGNPIPSPSKPAPDANPSHTPNSGGGLMASFKRAGAGASSLASSVASSMKRK